MSCKGSESPFLLVCRCRYLGVESLGSCFAGVTGVIIDHSINHNVHQVIDQQRNTRHILPPSMFDHHSIRMIPSTFHLLCRLFFPRHFFKWHELCYLISEYILKIGDLPPCLATLNVASTQQGRPDHTFPSLSLFMEVDTIHGHRLIGNGFHVEHRSFNVARKGGVVPSPFRTLLGRITR